MSALLFQESMISRRRRRSIILVGWIASAAIGLDGPDSNPASEALRFAILRVSKDRESIGVQSKG